MGTSKSKPSARPGSPLLPSWSDQDPVPPASPPATPPVMPSPAPVPPVPPPEVLEARRNNGMRRALKDFYKTGDTKYARRALGRFARGSMGGGSAAGARLARAARAGGAAFGALSGLAAGQPVAAGSYNLASLSGKPIGEAIRAIVDQFCPPGILDEEAIRASMSEALAEAFSGLDKFDPTAVDGHTVVVATRCFIAELVLSAVLSEQGKAAADVSPLQAVTRENSIRDIVRELTDLQATPVLQSAGAMMTPARIDQLVKGIATTVYEEIATWR